MGCGSTFDTLLRAELRGELRAKLTAGLGWAGRGGAGRGGAGRGGAGLASGHATVRCGGTGSGLNCNVRAQISSPRKGFCIQ